MDMVQEARYGCFLILPLKFRPQDLDRKKLAAWGNTLVPATPDLNENIKAMLVKDGPGSVGWGVCLEPELLTRPLEGRPVSFRVGEPDQKFTFTLDRSYLYLFHTQVAFLCLGLSFDRMETLAAVCNPGFAQNEAPFFWLDQTGASHPLDPDRWLSRLMEPLGLEKFFPGDSPWLLDNYAYIFGVMPQWFQTLEELRQITFSLHKMKSPQAPAQDQAEEDIRYVYAARNLARDKYRWGCCVASQTISYITADPEMDLEAERQAQARDGLPVVLLALYEKYTCLRFTQLMVSLEKKEIRSLKNLMLNFRAFGTVVPANLSRWHNVKQIYANLLEVNDIPAAISDVTDKLNLLAAHQEEVERARNETIFNLITLFGIVSILASVLSIVQILSEGGAAFWISTLLTTLFMVLVTAAAVFRR